MMKVKAASESNDFNRDSQRETEYGMQQRSPLIVPVCIPSLFSG
jgi:hypothetical protein